MNFISKKKSRWNASRLIIAFASAVFLLGAGTLYAQWSVATAVPADVQAQLAEQANVKAQLDAGVADPLQAVAKELSSIQSDNPPYVALYNDLVEQLGDTAILRTFDYSGGTLLQVNATFLSLEEVGATADRLQRLPYVRSVRPGDAVQTDQGDTDAALVIDINENGLRSLNARPPVRTGGDGT